MSKLGAAMQIAQTTAGLSGKVMDQFGRALTSVDKEAIVNIAVSQNMTRQQLFGSLQAAGYTREIRKEVAAMYDDAAAKTASTTATGAFTTGTITAKNAIAGLNATLFASPLGVLVAIIGATVVAYKAVTAWADRYKNKLKELREEYENLSGEQDSLQSEIDSNLSRLKELESIETPTLADQDEISRLKLSNTELETRIALLKTEKELKQAEVNDTFNSYVAQQNKQTFTHYQQGVQDSMSTTAGTANGPRNIVGTGSSYTLDLEDEIAKNIADAKAAQAQIDANIAAMAQSDNEDEKNRLLEANKTLKEQKDTAVDFLRKQEKDMAAQAEGVSYTDSTAKGLDAWHDLQVAVLAFSDDVEAAQTGLNQLFNDPRYAGEGGATESLKNVINEYGNAITEYDDIVQEAKDKGVDLERAVYGNIDTDSRQILEWTEASVEKFRDALTSWNINPDDMLGSYSTVLGSWDEYDGVPIAFSPILQTDNGPQVLSADTVGKYLSTLLDKVKQNGDWTTEDLLRLDTQGLEVDGIKIKNIIADCGDTAEKTAEQMHFSGATGALAEAKQRMEELKTKIHELYAANPQVKELIDTLIRLGLFSWDNLDGLVNQLNDVADAADDVTEAVSAWADLSDATDKLVSATETLRNAQEELGQGYLSAGTLKSMQEQYSAMSEIIVQYKLGMATAQQVYAEYKRLYEEDKASFQTQNALKLALTEEFYNNSIKGNANYIKILGTYYTSDLSNFNELAQKKLEIDTKLQQALGENWAKYYKTYADAVKASTWSGMTEEEYNKRFPNAAPYSVYLQSNSSFHRSQMTADQKAEYDRLMSLAKMFDALAEQANKDIKIKVPTLSSPSSSTSSHEQKEEPEKSMDERYADLKSLQEETERQNDRLSNMTQDTTAEQISLWYNLRKEAIKQLNQIADHTSEAYRYVEDIVKDCNSNISSLYDDQLDALDKIIDMTEDMLKKEADDQVDALEDQVDKYKEIVELKKKLLEQSSDEEDYEKKVAKLTKEIADIQESIGQLDLEIKSNPNDSRKAQAEQQKLMQSLKDKQDELYDLQRDHYKDSLTSRLDDEADAFEKSKQDEIDKIKETVDDDKKLHQKAIDYIDKNWDKLYDKLSKYAAEQGRDVEKELSQAWSVAKDAVDAYGGSILDAMDSIEKMQSMIQSTNKEGNYNQLGELAGNPQLMAIVKTMKQNSMDYLATSDTNVKQSIKANQADLKSQFEQISGRQLKQGSDGTWYLDKVGGETLYSHFGVGDVQNPNKQNSSAASSTTAYAKTKKALGSDAPTGVITKGSKNKSAVLWIQTYLKNAGYFHATPDGNFWDLTEKALEDFQTDEKIGIDGKYGPATRKKMIARKYHTGGVVGGGATLKDNEMLAVLEKKETVLTNSMWQNLTEKLNAVQDFIQSSLPVIDKFPAGAVPAYAGAGSMNIAPVINVQFEHHGDFDEKAAKKFASQISDFTIQQIKKNRQTHRYRK